MTRTSENLHRQIRAGLKRRWGRVMRQQLDGSIPRRQWETDRWAGSGRESAQCWRNCKNDAQLIQQVDSQREPLIEIDIGLSLVVRYNGWFYFACYKLPLFNPFVCFVFLFSSIKHADNNRAIAALFKTSASCDRLPTSASLFDDSDSRLAIIVADFSNTR